MNIKEFYEITGSNYQEAVTRMMNDAFVKRFALKFVNDKSFADLEANLEANNTENAFRAAHTLKGVCMNLAFTKLGKVSSDITEMLRGGDLAAAKAYFPVVKEAYQLVIEKVQQVA